MDEESATGWLGAEEAEVVVTELSARMNGKPEEGGGGGVVGGTACAPLTQRHKCGRAQGHGETNIEESFS